MAVEQQPQRTPDIFIEPQLINALRGTISEPCETISHKPGTEGQVVTVQIALEGLGMFGLSDWKDNKEWSGIFNHCVLSGRYAAYFSARMAKAGYETNPHRIANAMSTVSHTGRRQWDEANWYPDIVPDAQERKSVSNETLGLRLIHGKVPSDIFELVAALGHNTEEFKVNSDVFNSWDYKLAEYTDHRTTQRYESLNTRMGDFLLGYFFDRANVTPEIKEQVYGAILDIIERQKKFRFGALESVSLEEADKIAEELGAESDSKRLKRKELMRIILQDADTEAELIMAGIDPNEVMIKQCQCQSGKMN